MYYHFSVTSAQRGRVCLSVLLRRVSQNFLMPSGRGEQNKNDFNAGAIHLSYGLLNLYTNCLVFLKEMFPLKSRSQPSYSCRSVAKNVFLKWVRRFFQKVTGKEVLKMPQRMASFPMHSAAFSVAGMLCLIMMLLFLSGE